MQGVCRRIEPRIDDRRLDELITQLLRICGLMDQAAPLEFVKNRLHKLKTGFRLKLNFVFVGHRPTHIGEGLF